MANATEQNQFDQAVRLIEPGDSVVVGQARPSTNHCKPSPTAPFCSKTKPKPFRRHPTPKPPQAPPSTQATD